MPKLWGKYNSDEDLEEQIAQLVDPPIDYESNEEDKILSKLTHKQAPEYARLLRLSEEQQEDYTHMILSNLDDPEGAVKGRI